ncbi:MAG: hypothetical protein ACR2PL_01595 [Dehalococcoidia bacterium]
MGASRETLRALIVPAVVALVVILAYFFISQNWTNLGNPLASVAATVAGFSGFAAGVALDQRRRRNAAAGGAKSPAA